MASAGPSLNAASSSTARAPQAASTGAGASATLQPSGVSSLAAGPDSGRPSSSSGPPGASPPPTAAAATASTTPHTGSNPGPLLLPHNRRLRHLQGVYLRNLAFPWTAPAHVSSGVEGPAVSSASIVGRGRARAGSGAGTRDDAAIGFASPAKLATLKELREAEQLPVLHHALSSESLRASAKHGAAGGVQAVTGVGVGAGASAAAGGSARGVLGRRRASTVWGQATPVTRQKMLELAAESRLADAFFSLHCGEDSEGRDNADMEPLYVSEVVERSINFNYRLFDLTQLSPSVTRSSLVTIRFWTRRRITSQQTTVNQVTAANRAVEDSLAKDWSLHIEESVDLRRLHFLGSLTDHSFPPNCIVLQLVDGVYALELLTSTGRGGWLAERRPEPKQGVPPLPTSSYNALMRLANLDSAIRDALAVREELAESIQAILEGRKAQASKRRSLLSKPSPLSAPSTADLHSHVQLAKLSSSRAIHLLNAQQRTVEDTRSRIDSLRTSLASRRKAIAEGRELQRRAADDVSHAAKELLPASREAVRAVQEGIRGQRRRILGELDTIFRIGPVDAATVQRLENAGISAGVSSGAAGNARSGPLSFSICGLPLPNTDYNPLAGGLASDNEDLVSAALGYVSLLTTQLQFYLSTPLPYPLSPFRGSRCSVRDDISLLPVPASDDASSQRDFPLYLRARGGGGAAQFRLDYGWFLLNKDIEALCGSQGLRIVDVRHTLPNIKYLLYVCGAGPEEDVPARRRGGIKGLLLAATGKRGRRLGSAGGLSTRDSSIAARGGRPGSSVDGGSSRRGSADSERDAAIFHSLRRALLGTSPPSSTPTSRGNDGGSSAENGATGTGTTRLGTTPPGLEPIVTLPFDDNETKLTLRTKALRERS